MDFYLHVTACHLNMPDTFGRKNGELFFALLPPLVSFGGLLFMACFTSLSAPSSVVRPDPQRQVQDAIRGRGLGRVIFLPDERGRHGSRRRCGLDQERTVRVKVKVAFER